MLAEALPPEEAEQAGRAILRENALALYGSRSLVDDALDASTASAALYTSEWLDLCVADVELPDGTRFDHHVVRLPHPAVGVIVHDADRGVLLLRRHRFITDTWGWEIPAGRVDPGETLEQAAEREAIEETGWRPLDLEYLGFSHPTNGLMEQRFEYFLASRRRARRRLRPHRDGEHRVVRAGRRSHADRAGRDTGRPVGHRARDCVRARAPLATHCGSRR